jgi:hypothetical protein
MCKQFKLFLIGCIISTTGLSLSACGDGADRPATANDAGSLDEFFGLGDPAAQQAQFEKQQRKTEEAIATCMRAEGFEYTPAVQQATFSRSPQPKRGEEVAHKRKYGYNFAASMAQSSKPREPNENPNTLRLSKMTEGERNAYQKALYGFDVTKPQTEPSAMPDGCQNKAFGDQNELWKPLQPKFKALQRKTEADPDLVKLNASFASCMKKAGYPVSSDSDIYEKLLGPRQQEIFSSSFGSSPETTVSGSQLSIPTIPQGKIDEFMKYELQVANADADCRPQKDVDKIRELRAKYERGFIEENKVLLEKLKASQG